MGSRGRSLVVYVMSSDRSMGLSDSPTVVHSPDGPRRRNNLSLRWRTGDLKTVVALVGPWVSAWACGLRRPPPRAHRRRPVREPLQCVPPPRVLTPRLSTRPPPRALSRTSSGLQGGGGEREHEGSRGSVEARVPAQGLHFPGTTTHWAPLHGPVSAQDASPSRVPDAHSLSSLLPAAADPPPLQRRGGESDDGRGAYAGPQSYGRTSAPRAG